ncbi:MAG: hypothetical protein EXR72_10385 [Myxococcales bacterium]|nr:hypothetical protein [Myxococcales bacterium]
MRLLLGLLVLTASCGPHPSAHSDGNSPAIPDDLAAGDPPPGDDGGCLSAGGPDTRIFGPAHGVPFPVGGEVGVARNQGGELLTDPLQLGLDHIWLANNEDWQRGTLSKLHVQSLRETARYFTVTCHSQKTGGKQPCDGMNGCCAADSDVQFQRRLNKLASGPAQTVRWNGNSPSRTGVWRAEAVWVANRAFVGQGSVTKVAVNPKDCIERNGNGKIDTSSDVNGDGIIQTDCNEDGQPDDIDSVKAAPCKNGKPQEFYGLDDECVLFTTNVGAPNQLARALALAPAANPLAPWDPWVGTYQDGRMFHVAAATGQILEMSQLAPECRPYGAIVDGMGYGWTTGMSGSQCFFDTAHPASVGVVRKSTVYHSSYGISIDRDQNIWIGANPSRYTPDRTQGFKKLGDGYWTVFQNVGTNAGAPNGGTGIAVDARTPNAYFAWSNPSGWLVRIPASTIPLPQNQDLAVDGTMFPAVRVAGLYGRGVGVDRFQNLWTANGTGSVATRVHVNSKGDMIAPDIQSAPANGKKCPAGDRCAYADRAIEPHPYTYSDFTGFAALGLAGPQGHWTRIERGCDCNVQARWGRLTWIAAVPVGAKLSVRLRHGSSAKPDPTWSAWSTEVTQSPIDLATLVPATAGYLEMDFQFRGYDLKSTPILKGVSFELHCDQPQ